MSEIEINEENPLLIEAVKTFLPHRYPFLLVDRVTRVVPGEVAYGYKNVTYNEPFFTGHFPDLPIMPGVLIVEAVAQLSGILGFVTTGKRPADGVNYLLAGADDVRFKRPVVPGDQLLMETRFLSSKRHIWKFECVARVGSDVACRATIMTAEQVTT